MVLREEDLGRAIEVTLWLRTLAALPGVLECRTHVVAHSSRELNALFWPL